MNVFRDLLAIKQLREDRAEIDVSRKRTVLAAAQRTREDAVEMLETFRVFAAREEKRMYADLCSRVVTVRDIEDVQVSMAGLRQEEAHRDGHVQDTRAAEAEAETALGAARAAFHQASRDRQKIAEAEQACRADQHQAEQQQEDRELDETAGLMHGRVMPAFDAERA
jgi:type III secretion protein O